MKRRGSVLIAVLTAAALTNSACGSGGTSRDNETGKKAGTLSVVIGDKTASTGPAAKPAGARAGGTVVVYENADLAHLDPAQVYPSNAQAASMLFTRQLTAYKKVGGQWKLVGDLATDPGTSTDGGKTWTFTLKDGVRFADGTPVTSEHVKYGVERTYDPGKVLGPKYLPQWLSGDDYAKVYKGPASGGSLPEDVVSTPDSRTIVFHLKESHPEFPFAVAMPYSAPVLKKKDGKGYDTTPGSTGPYVVEKHDDRGMILARNPQWNPATDPLRTGLPDRWEFRFGAEADQIVQRLISDNAEDANAVTISTPVSSQYAQQVTGRPDLRSRLLSATDPYVYFYAINTSRVTDLNVRKALLTAFPRQQVRQIQGGPLTGDFASTLLGPTVQGYQNYDLFSVPPTGDPAAAKKLLNGATPTIVYGYEQNGNEERAAVAIQTALQKAGFKVVKKPINAATWYDQTTKKDNGLDLYYAGWAPDWPGGSGVLPVLFDGRGIADGTYNYARLNDPAVNTEIDRISKIEDLQRQNAAWAELDKKIMARVPVVPYVYERSNRLHGSNVGGAGLDIYGQTSLAALFLKH